MQEVFNMKNVRESQLKKCIFIEGDEFTELIRSFYPEIRPQGRLIVDYTLEGIDIYSDEIEINTDDIIRLLSKHFDVEVTSFHIDDCEYVGVWVAYKDKVGNKSNFEDCELKIQFSEDEDALNINDVSKDNACQLIKEIDIILGDIKSDFNPYYDSNIRIFVYDTEEQKWVHDTGAMLVEFAHDELKEIRNIAFKNI
jgi:hypothetical protein